MKKFGVATAAVALLLTSACGGDSRPSRDDIAQKLQSGMDQLGALGAAGEELTDEAADCMAEALEGSKLSDEALKAMVDGDSEFEPDAEDEKALEEAVPEFLKCIPGMADLQEQMEDLGSE